MGSLNTNIQQTLQIVGQFAWQREVSCDSAGNWQKETGSVCVYVRLHARVS